MLHTHVCASVCCVCLDECVSTGVRVSRPSGSYGAYVPKKRRKYMCIYHCICVLVCVCIRFRCCCGCDVFFSLFALRQVAAQAGRHWGSAIAIAIAAESLDKPPILTDSLLSVCVCVYTDWQCVYKQANYEFVGHFLLSLYIHRRRRLSGCVRAPNCQRLYGSRNPSKIVKCKNRQHNMKLKGRERGI